MIIGYACLLFVPSGTTLMTDCVLILLQAKDQLAFDMLTNYCVGDDLKGEE